MNARELSRKYATAIFSLALEDWLTVLNSVNEKLTESPDMIESLENPDRSFGDRQKELDQIIPGDSARNIRNFLYTLLKEENIGLLGETLESLERMAEGGPQVQVAYVTTASALSAGDQDQFRQKLRAQYGESLEFVFNVDPSIIGGAIVQVGDKVIDGSVAARLEAMSNALGVKN